MNEIIEFALIGQISPWLSDRIGQRARIQQIQSPEEIRSTASLILLNPGQPEQQLVWLRQLRANPLSSSMLIFSLLPEDQHDSESRLLLDGCWQSLEQIEAKLQEWQRRMALFKLRHPDPGIQQVLAYLWPREQKRMTPLADWQAPQLYRYPLLSCVSGNADEAALLLHRLRSRSLITPDRLIDRVRSCSACHSSHLSYIDQCPSCQSLNIEQQPAIHCFNCGHVARQEHFRRHGVLTCPNCNTRLRHIGSDYDRPMENFHCNACGDLFIEPEVRARCMQCGKSHQPEELRIELIHEYQLGEQGRMLCRHGETMAELTQLTTLDLIPQELFRFNLHWLDQLSVRYPDQGYSLMTLRLINVAEVVESRGYRHTMQIISALAERLRAELRGTDLATRTSDDLYWLLLPNTPAESMSVLKEKVHAVLARNQEGGGAQLRIDMASFSSSHSPHAVQDVGLLMDMLANEVSD